jgi:hypothetical protein
MMIYVGKSSIYYMNCDVVLRQEMTNIFLYPSFDLSDGLKYLGYRLKPSCYTITD